MKKRDFLKTTGAGLGATALTGLAAIKAEAESGAGPGAQVSEHEWARARHVAQQLPEAVRLVPGVQSCLTDEQIQELRRAYENVLITNMGCSRPS